MHKTILEMIGKFRGDNLTAKSVRSMVVLTVGTFTERIIRLIRNMLLARLLAPDDLGLMGLIFAVLLFVECVTSVGIPQAVIHSKEGHNKEYLNIVWWFQSVRGFCLFAFGYFATPLICNFYAKPELQSLLKVSFVYILFNGFVSPRIATLEKEFQFVKSIFLRQGCDLIGNLVTIALAFYIQNAWVLVIGHICVSLTRLFLSYVFCPFKPTFHFNSKHLQDIFKFSRGMFGLPILFIVSTQADIFVLSKLMLSKEVGLYVMALALAQQPATMFGSIVCKVLLPAFAKKQDNKQILCEVVLKITGIIYQIGIPIIILITVFAESILSLIYGKTYEAVAVPFSILCAAMLFRIQASVLAMVYISIGKPHLQRSHAVPLAVLIVALLYPGVKVFGLEGAAGALLVSYIISLFIQVAWMKKAIGLNIADYALSWMPKKYKHYLLNI